MQTVTGAERKRAPQILPKTLVPPIGYAMLDEGLHRAIGPISKHNLSFVAQLGIKSIICLASSFDSYDDPSRKLLQNDLNINTLYAKPLLLDKVSLSEAENTIHEVTSLLLDASVFPVLFVTSCTNFADLAVLGYIRKLQHYSLASIFWEIQLHAMRKVSDLEQLVEHMHGSGDEVLPAWVAKMEAQHAKEVELQQQAALAVGGEAGGKNNPGQGLLGPTDGTRTPLVPTDDSLQVSPVTGAAGVTTPIAVRVRGGSSSSSSSMFRSRSASPSVPAAETASTDGVNGSATAGAGASASAGAAASLRSNSVSPSTSNANLSSIPEGEAASVERSGASDGATASAPASSSWQAVALLPPLFRRFVQSPAPLVGAAVDGENGAAASGSVGAAGVPTGDAPGDLAPDAPPASKEGAARRVANTALERLVWEAVYGSGNVGRGGSGSGSGDKQQAKEAGSSGGLTLLSPCSTFDPSISLVDDKDDDD